MDARKWLSTELNKSDAMLFRACLILENIKFEPSSAGDLVHFEIFVNNEEKEMCEKCLAAM